MYKEERKWHAFTGRFLHEPKTRSAVQLFQETVIPENTAEDETQKTTKGLRVSQPVNPKATGTLCCLRATKKPWRVHPRPALSEDQRLPTCSLASVPCWGELHCTHWTVPPIIERER